MKALTIRQPWAWAIMAGLKDVENRSWPTKVRGEILIHAAGKTDPRGFEFLNAQGILHPEAYPLGALLGTVTLADCVTESPSAWWIGPHGFILKDPRRPEKPVKLAGRLGFFEVPDILWRAGQ